MIAQNDDLRMLLGVFAEVGKVADAYKKYRFHGHDPDWRLFVDQAMLAIGMLSEFVIFAETQIEQQGLSNVTLGPTLFGDHLPGDVADGVHP